MSVGKLTLLAFAFLYSNSLYHVIIIIYEQLTKAYTFLYASPLPSTPFPVAASNCFQQETGCMHFAQQQDSTQTDSKTLAGEEMLNIWTSASQTYLPRPCPF